MRKEGVFFWFATDRSGSIRKRFFWGRRMFPSVKRADSGKEAAEHLSGFSFQTDRIYASDLLRASQTAEILRERVGLARIVEEKGLREMNLGSWDGRFIHEIKREFPRSMRNGDRI